VRASFSAPVQTGPGAHPFSYTMGTGEFSGVMQPGRDSGHSHTSSAEAIERLGITLLPSGTLCPVLGRALPLFLHYVKEVVLKN